MKRMDDKFNIYVEIQRPNGGLITLHNVRNFETAPGDTDFIIVLDANNKMHLVHKRNIYAVMQEKKENKNERF